MSVVQDPVGAVFSLWQPNEHKGAQVVNEPGALCWNELYTTDPKRAADFFTGLFGWTKNARHMDYGEYVIFEQGSSMTAGMMQVPKEWGPVPPHWLVYFAVDDCDASVAKVTELGGEVLRPPTDMPYGRHADVADPQGAMFSVIKSANPES
jgi:predicted enzyme related to lactoylglutathione lyase